MQEDGNGSNEFRKLSSSMLNNISWSKVVIAIAFIAMAITIWWLWDKKPEVINKTTVDTNKVAPVIINNWPATATTQGKGSTIIYQQGMDSAMLVRFSMMVLDKLDSLMLAHTAVNRYDTTFKDSTYKETISIEVTRNRLARFTRNMEVYNRTTVMSEPDKVHYFGGVFAQGSSERAGLGIMLGIENKKRQLFTVGFDPINKVWVGGVSQRIR